MRFAHAVVVVLALAVSTVGRAADPGRAIGPVEARRAIEGIATRAVCSGPRGSFTTEVVALADGRGRFHQLRDQDGSDIVVTRAGAFARATDGSFAVEPPAAAIVAGHAVHRMLLDLGVTLAPEGQSGAAGCVRFCARDGRELSVCTGDGDLPSRLVVENPPESGGGQVTIELREWRSLLGLTLPFAATFRHAGKSFDYRYTHVLPFRIAPGTPLPQDPAALFERLGDVAELVSAHERAIVAHRTGDVSSLLADEAERSTVGRRGELVETARARSGARLGDYLERTRFDRYEDVVPPVVAVAADGSLAWLACQIEAAGVQESGATDPKPIDFGFAWVELYARAGDRWLRTGNVSTPR